MESTDPAVLQATITALMERLATQAGEIARLHTAMRYVSDLIARRELDMAQRAIIAALQSEVPDVEAPEAPAE